MNAREYVLEWSQQQGCFHIETIEEMKRRNLEAYNRHRVIEYAPVAIGLTHREAQELSERLESNRSPSRERAVSLFDELRKAVV